MFTRALGARKRRCTCVAAFVPERILLRVYARVCSNLRAGMGFASAHAQMRASSTRAIVRSNPPRARTVIYITLSKILSKKPIVVRVAQRRRKAQPQGLATFRANYTQAWYGGGRGLWLQRNIPRYVDVGSL